MPASETDVVLSEDQSHALSAIMDFVADTGASHPRVLRIGGLAGTGKTTLSGVARKCLQEKGLVTQSLAFTNKAVSVLRRKGNTEAKTLHSVLYSPVPPPTPPWVDKNILEKEGLPTIDATFMKPSERSKWGKAGYRIRTILGEDGWSEQEKKEWEEAHPLEFSLKGDSELPANVLMIDEASQVQKTVWEDLLEKVSVPIILIGDHGQLEPIGEDVYLMESPDVTLETIHRQEKGSTIIEFAHDIRNEQCWGAGVDGEVTVANSKAFWEEETFLEYDQMLVATHRDRARANKRWREAHDYDDILVEGERLMCLKSDPGIRIANGEIFTVEKILSTEYDHYVVNLVDEHGRDDRKNVEVYTKHLGEPKLPYGFLGQVPRGIMISDYAYACTVHKFQGSEADKGAVLDSFVHDGWNMTRWRYTAATRFRKHLKWCASYIKG